MNLITKVGSVVGSIGIVGGGVAITNHFYKGYRDISERLTGVGYQVLKFDGDVEEWAKINIAYQAERTENKKFSGDESLKVKCKNVLALGPHDENNYKLAKRWCVKEETVMAMLTRNQYTKLEVSTAGTTQKEKWKTKVDQLKEASASEIKINIDFSQGNEDSWITSLEASCGTLLSENIKTHNDEEFEKKFMQAKLWCSEKTPNK